NVSSLYIRKKISFMSYYDNSVYEMLKKVYPEHEWDPLRFGKVPQGYWHNLDNQRKFLDRIGEELGVKELDDWYKVDSEEVRRRATFIRDYYSNSVFEALKKLHPEHQWDPTRFYT